MSKAAGEPSSVIAVPITTEACMRDQPSPSIAADTTTSSSEMADVRAPTTRRREEAEGPRSACHTAPISEKAWGSVMKSAPTRAARPLRPGEAQGVDQRKHHQAGEEGDPQKSAPAITTDSLGRCWHRDGR